ncbi:Hypothetical protein FKW44_019920, partial [Caligus rogercresseyi]
WNILASTGILHDGKSHKPDFPTLRRRKRDPVPLIVRLQGKNRWPSRERSVSDV